jgi:hypothetical protein
MPGNDGRIAINGSPYPTGSASQNKDFRKINSHHLPRWRPQPANCDSNVTPKEKITYGEHFPLMANHSKNISSFVQLLISL